MAQTVMAVAAVASLALAGYSTVQQKKAADEAKELAAKNALYAKLEAEEEARRLEEETIRQSSLIQAIQGASGAEGETQDVYLKEFESQRAKEIDWIRKSGVSRAGIATAQGAYAYAAGTGQASSTLAQGLGQSASWYMRWSNYSPKSTSPPT